MTRTVERIAAWLLITPAVVPLLYADGTLYPYVTVKTLLLRSIGIALIALIACFILSNRGLYWDRLKGKTTWIPGILLLIAYLTSLLGLDFYHSFWSTFERGDGLLTITTVIVFFYAMLLYAEATLMRRIMSVVISVAALLSAYTILQWIQTSTGINIPVIEEPRGRFGATFGNAAYLASYLGLTFFITLAHVNEYIGNIREKRWLRFLYASAAVQVFAILLAATRGTLLALVVTAFISLVYVSLNGVPGISNVRWRNYARYVLAASVIAAVLFFMFRSQLQHVPIEFIRRVASISTEETTVSSRFFVWRNMTANTARTAPLIGYGAEHIAAPFDAFYDPTAIVEEWFDRSHNAYLDYFVQFGIVGALLYVLLVGTFLYKSLRMFRGGDVLGAFLFFAGLTYAVQNFFVFDTANTFWLFLTLLASMHVAQGSVRQLARIPKMASAAPVGVGLVVLILLVPVSIQPLRANLLLAKGYYWHMSDVNRSIEALHKGFSLNTYADVEYGYNLYKMYTEHQHAGLQANDKLDAYVFARDTLAKNYERYPYDARTVVYYAHVLDLAPPGMQDEEELKRVSNQAIKLSPKRMQPHYLIANISLRKGDALPQGSAEKRAHYLEAIRILDEYASTVPLLAEPRFVIATLYLTIGEPNVAKEWADEALPLYKRDYAVAKRAARFYLLTEDYENARKFLYDAVTTSETPDYPLMYDYAKASFLTGDKEEAARIVEKLRVDAPGLVETDPAFLEALNSQEVQ